MNKQEAMQEVKETLKAYNECYLMLNDDNTYSVKVSITLGLRNEQLIAIFKDKDVFNHDELIVNYIKEFRSYPISYNGVKDYQKVKKVNDNTIIRMVDGNIVFEF